MIKKIFKKRNITLLSLVLLLILALVVTYYIDLSKFNSKLVKYDEDYLIKITYLIGDKDELPEDVTIDETIYDHPESIIYVVDQVVPLIKDGDYLYTDLSKFTNKILLQDVAEVTYSKLGVYADMIEGCSYDKETKVLKVPYSFYENSEKNVPIQVEIESLLTKEQTKGIKTDYSVKKLITYTNEAKNDLIELDTKISLSNYVNGNLSYDNLFVYLNNANTPVSKEYLSYNDKTKVLSINIPAVLINRVDIRLGNNIIKNVFAYDYYDYSDMHEWHLSAEPSSDWTVDSVHYTEYTDFSFGETYWSDYSRFIECTNGSSDWCGTGADPDYSYYSYNGSYVTVTDAKDIKGETPFIVRLSFVGTSGISFTSSDEGEWIVLACANHDTEHSDGIDNIQLRVTVEAIDRTNRYMILKIDTFGQNDWGSRIGITTQIGLSYIKVVWEEETPPPQPQSCNVRIRKILTTQDTNDTNVYVANFGMYSNSSCSGNPMAEADTFTERRNGYSTTVMQFNNVGEGLRYFKENSIKKLNLPEGIEYGYCAVIQPATVNPEIPTCASMEEIRQYAASVQTSSTCQQNYAVKCFYRTSDTLSDNAGAAGISNFTYPSYAVPGTNTGCISVKFRKKLVPYYSSAHGGYIFIGPNASDYWETNSGGDPDSPSIGGNTGNENYNWDSLINNPDVTKYKSDAPVMTTGGNLIDDFETVPWPNTPGLVQNCVQYGCDDDSSSGCKNIDAAENHVWNNNEIPRKYCYSIVKKDKGTNDNVSGATWTLVGADGVTYSGTTNGAIVTWKDLPLQNYTLKETGSPSGYWNEFENGITVSQNDLTIGDTCTPVEMKDPKKYYCLKVKKVDYSTGETINGAEFEAKNPSLTINKNSGANYYNSSNGVVSFFIENPANAGDFNVTETKAPDGYEKDNTTHTLQAILLSKEYTTVAAARQACFGNGNTADGSTMNTKTINSNNGNNSYVFKDKKYLINWYKTTENGTTKVDGAEFRVKASNGKFITVSNAPESITDASGVTRACYKYTGEANTGNVMISGDKGSTNVTMTGEVCVSGLPTGTYQVIEIKAPEYHTFGTGSTKSITTSTSFANMSDINKLVNYPTEFKFTKDVINTDGSQTSNITVNVNGVNKTLSEITTEELMKIGFTIYDSNGNAVPLKEISAGNYEYGSNTIDQAGTGNNVTVLHLSSSREIYVKHLPKGTYTIKEVDTSSCALDNGGFNTVDNPTTRPSPAPSCSGGGTSTGSCIGYYSPDYSSNTYSFTIDDCSSAVASQNAGSCPSNAGVELQSLTNIPTEIIFTKKDLYSYQDQADIVDSGRDKNTTESAVEFENAKERSDFDRIDFKVKDSSGNYLNFIYVGGTSTTCTSDSDYSIYRYVPGLSLPSGVDANVFNYHTNGNGLTITQTLHACGGHIKLIGLCRGETYTFEEIRVPDDSVYVLEKAGELNPSVCFEVPCSTDESEHRTSKTAVINDKPTRVTFEKRDGKYNYLIPDETTTFEVYRCPKGASCNPSAYSTVAERESAGMKLIKFEKRAVIANDDEDTGIEVYKMMSDSDAQNKQVCANASSTNCYETEVHPYNGRLVLRYLQSGYNYVLLETKAPSNYLIPTGTDAETSFTVVNTTVDVQEISIPNAPTALIIRKYADIEGDGVADSGKLLGGAKFKVYKVINYNPNKKVQDQEKQLISLKTIKDGIYENRPVLDTDVITTCSGESCSYDPASLGYGDAIWENIDDLIEASGNNVTSVLKEGTALIQYLEYDTYYIIEEVEAPVGYSLPEKDDNRFTLVHIEKNATAIADTEDALVNKPSSFTFYKFDEYNTPLDGATFYLQKLDQDKKYNTLTVSKETLDNGKVVYKADPNSELTDITTTEGHATVYYLEPGQYRILEVAAPEGYELPKKTINVATFFVDRDGLVYGNNIISNKKPQEVIEYFASDKAELIINIQTGKVVIKYGLIIVVLVGAIAGLIIFLRKRK